MAITKNTAEAQRRYDNETLYSPTDAVDLIKDLAFAKFDESVDAAFVLGIDARQAEQIVRGTVSLPHGSGKDVKIVVFANDQAKEAEEAGADIVGGKDLADQIVAGMALDWDITIATPDMMPVVGKLGQLLGPRGLMPNPKTGTVTKDVGATVTAFKSRRVSERSVWERACPDRQGLFRRRKPHGQPSGRGRRDLPGTTRVLEGHLRQEDRH
jgi:large subunit ribosomal protein L1